MLTRHAKAHSSSCSQIQTASLSPAISTRLLRGYRSLMPSCAGFLNLENRDLNRRNLRSMLKISYTTGPCLSQLVSAQFALEMYLAAGNCQKIRRNLCYSVQSHPRSLNSAAIERQCTFLLVINNNQALSRTVIEIQRLIG